MTDFDKALNELKETLFADPLVEQYLALSHEVETASDLIALEANIKAKQQELSLAFSDDENYFRLKDEYLALVNQFNNDPRIINLEFLKNEIHGLLSEIRTALDE